jgi:ribosome-associated toxin RatA of RatAB toxin-antitoxin module
MILESSAKNTPSRRAGADLPTVQRSARVPYTAAQMFELVNDIERYPEFLHWCTGAHVHSRQGNVVEATLDIGVLGFHRSFRTRNTLTRPQRIQIELVTGPFRRMRGEWSFADLAHESQVALSLAFEVTVSPFGIVFSKLFEELAGAQMAAFVSRARELYG